MVETKTTHFLTISLVLVSIFCILIFSIQTVAMNMMGASAIREIGVIYMSGMSKQVATHFGTTIELRVSQVRGLVDAVPPESMKSNSALRVELSYIARSRGFECLAFYTDDGRFDMIYGPKVKPEVPQALNRAMQVGKESVSAARDTDGKQLVLMGVPAVYPLDGGEKSAALVAGLPTSYLSDTLAVNLDSSLVEYSIIRRHGTYILCSSGAKGENYFESIKDAQDKDGVHLANRYIEELKAAMDADRDYAGEVEFSGSRRNLYCTGLPDSEWFLVLQMPYNMLDVTIDSLGKKWSFISVSGCILMLSALLFVFAGYFRLTRKQMHELDEARQSADLAREHAERANKAKSEFLSNMSHDIRTPMNGIMGMTTVAINNLHNPPQVRSCLKRIGVSSRHLLGLINDMLDMSKIESGRLTLRMEPLSLRDVMENIMTIIQPQVHEKKQEFNIYVYGLSNENVCSDRVRLSQILLNILGNAVKFTPEKGKIEVGLREKPSPKGKRYIRSSLYIKDNGIGMSQEFQKRVFDAFAREDHGRVEQAAGAGMGMAITKYIVDAMGGTITVNSEPGIGSEFCITLDMEKAMQQEPEMALPQRDVLVLDDDEKACGIATDILASIGLDAEYALDQQNANEKITQLYTDAKGYPIVLLDWNIQGQDGIGVARKLRQRYPGITIVLLSDGDWGELESEAEEAGVEGFIAKPLFRSSLYYGLRQLVEAEVQPVQEQEETVEIDLSGRRVLFAEDNELNWEIADATLSEFGLELDWAENGKVCLEKFKQSETGWYDVVLMDLRMPEMTGFEAAAAIRALERDDAKQVPIIAVSADAFDDDVQKCMECGMDGHTSKPYDVDAIIGLLNKHLK